MQRYQGAGLSASSNVDAVTFENPFSYLMLGLSAGLTLHMFMHFAVFHMSGAPRMVEFFLGPD
jgi:hypothetical protein